MPPAKRKTTKAASRSEPTKRPSRTATRSSAVSAEITEVETDAAGGVVKPDPESAARATRPVLATSAPREEGDYILLARLVSSDDPVITRLLCVSPDLTLPQFHQVLQAAFGWSSSHAHNFFLSKILDDENDEERDWMTGRGMTLLTTADDEFMANALSDSHTKVVLEKNYKLSDLFEDPEYKGKVEMGYEYDHGDGWDHSITLLARADPTMRRAMLIPASMKAVCIAGEGHPCAEDCGGADGWADLKRIFKAKGRNSDPDDRKEWYKETCWNGDPKGLDPYKWDIFEVNQELNKLDL